METSATPDSDETATTPSAAFQSHSSDHQSEIDEYLEAYPYASEPSYFTRPNRYHGPSSTWRSWTADDRAVAESLDVIRARDLSVHLYNAFDLRSRVLSRLHVGDTGAERDLQSDEQQAARQEFTPPDVWTAWPLRGKDVPRTSNIHDARDHVQLRTRPQLPSTALEDALVATTLRHARQRWDERTDEPRQAPLNSTRYSWKNERDLTKREASSPLGPEKDQSRSHSPHSVHRDSTPDSVLDGDTSDVASVTGNLPEGVQFFSSQAFATAETSSSLSEDDESVTHSEDDRPVFSADDQFAHDILRPTTRHILTKFDDLLDGLHRARAAYAMGRGHTRSRSRSVFSSVETTEDDHLVRSGSRAASKKRGRKRKRSPSQSADNSQTQNSSPRGRSALRGNEKPSQTHGLRDWSDIMGMATLTGWNVEVVARASERCAKLFGQNMTFRTFHQGPVDGAPASQEAPWFEEEAAYVPSDRESDVRASNHTVPIRPQPNSLQPIEYMRTSPRCSRCQLLKIRCNPPKSISTTDITQTMTCLACSLLPNPIAPCSGITIQPRPTPTTKTCPYSDCPRHDPAKPFPKNYHLQRHLKDVHNHDDTSPASSPTKATTPDTKPNTPTREQFQPKTTLICPITPCLQNGRIYKRSTRLYDHVRQVHPEVDVASLKKIMAKVSERGRYDRSRSRSRGAVPVEVDHFSPAGGEEARISADFDGGGTRESNDQD